MDLLSSILTDPSRFLNMSGQTTNLMGKRYGIDIPKPDNKIEEMLFNEWLSKNNVNDYGNTDYDYFSAFKSGIGRDASSAHFPDTYKLPWHPTFSIESSYYKPGMKAGKWDGEKFIPIN